jgi:hypothetical protein
MTLVSLKTLDRCLLLRPQIGKNGWYTLLDDFRWRRLQGVVAQVKPLQGRELAQFRWQAAEPVVPQVKPLQGRELAQFRW